MLWSSYAVKSLWFIGFIVLLLVSGHLHTVVQHIASIYFNVVPELWYGTCAPFFLGIYFGLLFIVSDGRQNRPIFLCVFLPCFVVSFYPLVAALSDLAFEHAHLGLRIPVWFTTLGNFSLIPAFAGIALMKGLFGGKRRPRFR